MRGCDCWDFLDIMSPQRECFNIFHFQTWRGKFQLHNSDRLCVFAKWPNAFWKPEWFFLAEMVLCEDWMLLQEASAVTAESKYTHWMISWFCIWIWQLRFFSSVSVHWMISWFLSDFKNYFQKICFCSCICICNLEAKMVQWKDRMLLQPNKLWAEQSHLMISSFCSELLCPTLFEWVCSTIGDSAVQCEQGERHLSPFGTVLRRWSSSGFTVFTVFYSFKTVELERTRRRRGEIWFKAEPPSCSSIRQ